MPGTVDLCCLRPVNPARGFLTALSELGACNPRRAAMQNTLDSGVRRRVGAHARFLLPLLHILCLGRYLVWLSIAAVRSPLESVRRASHAQRLPEPGAQNCGRAQKRVWVSLRIRKPHSDNGRWREPWHRRRGSILSKQAGHQQPHDPNGRMAMLRADTAVTPHLVYTESCGVRCRHTHTHTAMQPSPVGRHYWRLRPAARTKTCNPSRPPPSAGLALAFC